MTWAVVGGGIAGLAAAWELRNLDPAGDVVVYEPGPPGGKLRTSPFAGCPLDEGADAFLARVPWGFDLCAELGLGDQLVSPATSAAYVAWDGALRPLPAGLVLGVPTDPGGPFGDRVAAEPDVPGERLAPGDDPSVGALIRRRFGDDVLERLVDPLLGGINAGDSDRLSLRAAAPQLAAAAERSASIIEGLAAASAASSAPADPAAPVFWAVPGGMTVLVDALVRDLRRRHVTFVDEAVDDARALDADGIVLAVPAAPTSAIAAAAGAWDATRLLATLGHASPVLVALAFRRDEVAHPLDASGLLVPRSERRLLTACTFATTKWAHLDTGPDTVVLRASAGRYGDDRAIDTDDTTLVAGLLADLDALLGIGGDPTEVRVSRWRDGFPQYEPGHLDRVAAIEADLAAHLPNVAVAGAAYRGIGVPACIRQGREAAAAVVARSSR